MKKQKNITSAWPTNKADTMTLFGTDLLSANWIPDIGQLDRQARNRILEILELNYNTIDAAHTQTEELRRTIQFLYTLQDLEDKSLEDWTQYAAKNEAYLKQQLPDLIIKYIERFRADDTMGPLQVICLHQLNDMLEDNLEPNQKRRHRGIVNHFLTTQDPYDIIQEAIKKIPAAKKQGVTADVIRNNGKMKILLIKPLISNQK